MKRQLSTLLVIACVVFVVINVILSFSHERLVAEFTNGSAMQEVRRPQGIVNSKEVYHDEPSESWEQETLVDAQRQRRPTETSSNETDSLDQKIFKVLHWRDESNPIDESVYDFTSCPVGANQCAATKNESEADVFVMNAGRTVRLPRRKPGDVFVMITLEPSSNFYSRAFLKTKEIINQVNWTYTILPWSTWRVKYGEVFPLDDPPVKNYHAMFQQKKFEVAWFVSHCGSRSRRDEYVERMRSTVPVHIYGKCGTRVCGSAGGKMGGKRTECMDLLQQKYKFYLSFENSFCKYYVSEKVFAMYEIDVIPVVRGGANYSNDLPDGTYINSADFSSPEELGTYLHDLAHDEKRYTQMMRRKNRFRATRMSKINLACEICKKMHSNPEPHWVHDPYEFFAPERNCWPPDDL